MAAVFLVSFTLFPLGIAAQDAVPAAAVSPRSSFFVGMMDERRFALRAIEASYRTTRDRFACDDRISYRLEGSPTITAISWGSLSDGRFTVRLQPDYSPDSVEHLYRSAIENLDFWEYYEYRPDGSVLFTDRKAKRSSRLLGGEAYADSVTMMEFLVFCRTEAIKELHMTTSVSPGAIRLPFVFRRVGEERVAALDGREYDCWVYSAELDSFLSFLVKLFYVEAKVWVMKSFPHIRVKMDFFRKQVILREFRIDGRTATAAAAGMPSPD
jgi:hypothetical protein